jgi:ribonuclease E
MESAKNQREVENRLRDALKYDRARVQLGKISRFGLMELSRQRLRPALAESAYIPCPRCHGIGHIRGTESTALHILRILQEEAMKDNTAQVVAQMPVDVATFLLNEKRSDVLSIETRFKVNVLLVPNRHLETPNYSIERLRHDDLNLGEPLPASFQLVSQPEEEVAAKARKDEVRDARQEAVVKGITPAQPAPIPVARAATATRGIPAKSVSAGAAREGTWLSRMLAWFQTKPAEMVATTGTGRTAETAVKPTVRDLPGRDLADTRGRAEPRRDKMAHDERSGGRHRRDERRGEALTQAPARDAGPGTPQPRKREERKDARRDDRRNERQAEPRAQRQKPPRETHVDAATSKATTAPATGTAPPTAHADSEERREGGRRRRGRRGRGGDRAERPSVVVATPDSTSRERISEIETDINAVDVSAAGIPASKERTVASHVVETEERANIDAVSNAYVSAPTVAMPPAPEPERAAPSAPTTQATTVEELATPRNLPEIPPVTDSLPPDSDLVLVETRHAVPAAPEDEAAQSSRPKRMRPPRVEMANEPLEMVETHKDATPPAP